ncbi:MAG TPA: BMP family ABC transporter substrate-binding protein [Candidatus Limnocylindrales bacterium]|jgi:basic membrane protein A
MRIRTRGFGMLAGIALIVSACSGSATPVPPTVAPSVSAPSVAPSTPPASVAPSSTPAPSFAQKPGLKIGVVTDIGTLDDKGYNEFSFKGAQDGATAIGVTDPVPSIVPKDASEYAADIQQFVSQKFDVIVTVGFNLTTPTVDAAHKNPNIKFIGVDQSPECILPTGAPDPNFACKGVPATALPNYTSLYFAEDQAGYLAGIVAAYADKGAPTPTGVIGAIGGTTLCAPCVRYIQGYTLGAQSVNPSITVKSAYVTHDFSNAAFNDPAGGKAFAQTFIQANKPDVLFQVAGKTGNGVLEAACAANIYGIGVDVDQWASLGAPANACIITSAEKHVESAVAQAIEGIAAGTLTAGDVLFNAKNDGISAADFHDKASLFGPEVTTALNTAMAAMQAGTLVTCPATGCGVAP